MTARCHLLDLFISRRIGLLVRKRTLTWRLSCRLDGGLAHRAARDEADIIDAILDGSVPSPMAERAR